MWTRAFSSLSVYSRSRKLCMIIIIPAYIRTSLDSYFCLTTLALNVRSSVQICDDSLYVHIRLDRLCLPLSLWTAILVFGYIVTYCRYICTSLDPCLSLSFSLNASISVWLSVTDCTCSGTSLDPRCSLSFSVSQCPGMLSVILCVYGRLLICISFSLFVSKYLYHCPTILWSTGCGSLDRLCFSFFSEYLF